MRLLAIVLMVAGAAFAQPRSIVDPTSPQVTSDDCCRHEAPAGREDDDRPHTPCRNCGAACCAGMTAIVTASALPIPVDSERPAVTAYIQSDRCAFADPLLDPPRA